MSISQLDTFTPEQRKIYEITKSYLEKHPHFTIDELYSICKRNSNFDDTLIIKTLEQFFRKKIFVPGSRMTKENILDNANRKEIYDYIAENPGVNFSQILNQFGLGPHAGRWHLEMLNKFQFIKTKKHSIYKTFFTREFPDDKEIPVFLLRNSNIMNIYRLIKTEPLNTNDLAKILDLHYSTVKYHIKRLLKNKLIQNTTEKKYAVITELTTFLEKYYDFMLSPELMSKLGEYMEEKAAPTISEAEDEVIKVLREYDYFGGDIRYKVAVQNHSKMTISKIDIMLTASSQYRVDDRIKTIDYLVPGETRGVEFFLAPLTCGKSLVYATVAYTDGFGKPQTAQVNPKEIWIKCPLVSPEKVLQNQVEEWKRNLLKGTSKISFQKFPLKQVFDIAYNQITALDLSEVMFDENQFYCMFSGLAKVTSTKMMVETKVEDGELLIDVWADNLRQATGFLAYIRNLVNLALENAQKLLGKVETLGQSVLDIFELSNRIFEVFELCDKGWIVSDIIIILKEIHSRMTRTLPDIEIIDEIDDWVEYLEPHYKMGDNIREVDGLKIQAGAQSWLGQLKRLAKANIENFSLTFKEEEFQIEQLNALLMDFEQKFLRITENLVNKLLSYLIIIHKLTGISLYSQTFKESQTDADLLSGFLTAIQEFGAEIAKESSSMKKIEYHGFEINLEDGEQVRVALILNGAGPEILRKKLILFTKEFERTYTTELEKFVGDISIFDTAEDLVTDCFVENLFEEITTPSGQSAEEVRVKEDIPSEATEAPAMTAAPADTESKSPKLPAEAQVKAEDASLSEALEIIETGLGDPTLPDSSSVAFGMVSEILNNWELAKEILIEIEEDIEGISSPEFKNLMLNVINDLNSVVPSEITKFYEKNPECCQIFLDLAAKTFSYNNLLLSNAKLNQLHKEYKNLEK